MIIRQSESERHQKTSGSPFCPFAHPPLTHSMLLSPSPFLCLYDDDDHHDHDHQHHFHSHFSPRIEEDEDEANGRKGKRIIEANERRFCIEANPNSQLFEFALL